MKNLLGKMGGLKTKLLKIKIMASVIGIGAGLIFLAVIIGYVITLPQAAMDKVAEIGSSFFEKFGNFFVFGQWESTEGVFKEEMNTSRMLNGINIDTAMVASPLTIENEDFERYNDEEKKVFYDARLKKITVDIGEYGGSPGKSITRSVTYVKAIAYNQVGYYDTECFYDEDGNADCEDYYEETFEEYMQYKMPPIETDYHKQAMYDDIVEYEKNDEGELIYTVRRTWFFSYEKLMYFLDKTYVPNFHNDIINNETGYDQTLVDALIRRSFYRRDSAVDMFYGNEDEGAIFEGVDIQSIGTVSSEKLPSDLYSHFISPMSECNNQTSCFGYYTTEPGSLYCEGHPGIDIGASTHTKLFAVADGEVIFINRSTARCLPPCNCRGNEIYLKHIIVTGEGENEKTQIYYTKYLHLDKFSPEIYVNKIVEQGDLLGYAGTTGCSTGVHLHFEFLDENQQLINPESFLAGVGWCGNLDSSCSNVRTTCDRVRGTSIS